jgi:hypothetical protein
MSQSGVGSSAFRRRVITLIETTGGHDLPSLSQFDGWTVPLWPSRRFEAIEAARTFGFDDFSRAVVQGNALAKLPAGSR